MAQSIQETERKYAAPAADDISWLSELVGAGPVVSLADRGVHELDAVYYDTEDLRLTSGGASLRRRTGGTDAGWHLKLPLSGDSREEIRLPLSESDENVPADLRELTLSRTRGAPLRPVVRIRSTRSVRDLLDAEGVAVAEVSLDSVRADSRLVSGLHAMWTEMEVELAEGGDPRLLKQVEKVLRRNGIERADSPSKVARALRETTPAPNGDHLGAGIEPDSAGAHVHAYIERLVRGLSDLDPAVRRDRPDAVHKTRTTIRRLRSCLRSCRSVLDRQVTDPVRAELKWLAGELADERDHEVLRDRLAAGVTKLPGELVLGPVSARLQVWDAAEQAQARRRTLAALASPRYLELLESLTRLLEDPPLRAKASGRPEKVLTKAIVREHGRLRGRMDRALALPAGPERDAAVHHARKAAKRVRYAAEAARPALGKPAKRLGKRMKAVQQISGDHHDGVVARDVLRDLAIAAHAAGEPNFTWGVLYGEEMASGEARERQLPEAWRRARKAKLG
ncbi:CHAD domain-containing protein [Streptomyces sp. NPDC057616]|uniref:CYTH and CHAD domain-containing protein n=1 Tax=Streptomyces sp. NPDC057616 TaxID=3346183 RepID=UPI0036CC3774